MNDIHGFTSVLSIVFSMYVTWQPLTKVRYSFPDTLGYVCRHEHWVLVGRW